MDDTELLSKTVRYIGEYLETDVSHLCSDSRLSSAIPGIDSLRLVELMLYLQERFHIELDETVVGNLDTLGELVRYINSRLQETVT